jgi:hypothetical protein
MGRAEEILAHPLAKERSTYKITLAIDNQTQQVVDVQFDHNNLDKTSWAYVALLMRPIIFLTNDPVSIPVLTGEIEREHKSPRGQLKPLRTELDAWRKRLFVGTQNLGPVGNGSPVLPSIWTAPPGTPPPGLDPGSMVSDYYYADIFFNGCLWHSDDAKAAEYQDASQLMKSHIAKCAEIRTLTAIRYVASLHRVINDALERPGMTFDRRLS